MIGLRMTEDELRAYLEKRGKVSAPRTHKPDAVERRPGPVPPETRRLGVSKRTPAEWIARLGREIEQGGLGEPKFEFEFTARRRYRSDIALLGPRVLVELDGLYAHGRKENVARDREKDGAALELGWLTVRVTPRMVETGAAFRAVCAAVGMRWKEVPPR